MPITEETLTTTLFRRPIAALLAVSCLVLSACGGTSASGNEDAETPAAAPPAASASGLAAYPDLYRSMDLPALPESTVTSTGRQTTSLRDGLAIRLTTTMGVAEAREYYRGELTRLGWVEEPGPGRDMPDMDLPVARVAFAKGALTYSALITAADDGASVIVNVMEP